MVAYNLMSDERGTMLLSAGDIVNVIKRVEANAIDKVISSVERIILNADLGNIFSNILLRYNMNVIKMLYLVPWDQIEFGGFSVCKN